MQNLKTKNITSEQKENWQKNHIQVAIDMSFERSNIKKNKLQQPKEKTNESHSHSLTPVKIKKKTKSQEMEEK